MTPFCLPAHAQRVQFYTHSHPTWPLPGVFHTELGGAGRFDTDEGVSFAVAEVCSWEGEHPKSCTPDCRQRCDCPLRSEPAAVVPSPPQAAA